MLDPLQQWICDTCAEVIKRPEQGWIEWLADADGEIAWSHHGFKIVHHKSNSPRRSQFDTDAHCYNYTLNGGKRPGLLVMDTHLDDVVGEAATPFVMMFVDPGPISAPTYQGPLARDLREWAEFSRRLTIPYYEEGRFYWEKARSDGWFESAVEIQPFTPSVLREIIQHYSRTPARV